MSRHLLAAVALAVALGACQSVGTAPTPTVTSPQATDPATSDSLPVGDPSFPMSAPGACHVGQRNGQPTPDPACTPGALNPDVTQATIGATICVTGWTKTVRPPASTTNRWKALSAASYGVSVAGAEYDHDVPLELGGAPLDTRNLWPEPGAIPNPKDRVEDYLHRQVCAGRMSLRDAQVGIAQDWTRYLAAAGAEG